MALAVKRMTELELDGRRLLIRQDLNVPIKDGEVTSGKRLSAALPTIEYALQHRARVALVSHLGRPREGTVDAALSLAPAGAGKVVISAPAGTGVDATIVYGVNHQVLKSADEVISNASCTTNCLAPLAKVLNDTVGIEHGLMTTIHAYTNDQVLTDVYHSDLRRARSATQSMIPTKTGAAATVGLVLPELDGRLDGFSMRVPTINVSVVDLTFSAGRETTTDEIDRAMRAASEGELKGVLAYCDQPLVSVDFNHNPASAIYDASLTKILGGRLVKVCAWYDNEWGFSNRMLDTTLAFANAA